MQLQKILKLPHRRDWNFLGGGGGGGGGSVRPKNLKKRIKINWNFHRGGVLEKIPFVGEVWAFSGIKHWFGHGLLTSIMYCYMQTILQADWLQSRAVTRFSSGDVQKVAGEPSWQL